MPSSRQTASSSWPTYCDETFLSVFCGVTCPLMYLFFFLLCALKNSLMLLVQVPSGSLWPTRGITMSCDELGIKKTFSCTLRKEKTKDSDFFFFLT